MKKIMVFMMLITLLIGYGCTQEPEMETIEKENSGLVETKASNYYHDRSAKTYEAYSIAREDGYKKYKYNRYYSSDFSGNYIYLHQDYRYDYEGFMKFDTSGLPNNSIIKSAWLCVNNVNYNDHSPFLSWKSWEKHHNEYFRIKINNAGTLGYTKVMRTIAGTCFEIREYHPDFNDTGYDNYHIQYINRYGKTGLKLYYTTTSNVWLKIISREYSDNLGWHPMMSSRLFIHYR